MPRGEFENLVEEGVIRKDFGERASVHGVQSKNGATSRQAGMDHAAGIREAESAIGGHLSWRRSDVTWGAFHLADSAGSVAMFTRCWICFCELLLPSLRVSVEARSCTFFNVQRASDRLVA